MTNKIDPHAALDVALKRLPKDLAVQVVLTGISNDPMKLAKMMQTVAILMAMRAQEQDKLVMDSEEFLMEAMASKEPLLPPEEK